MNRNISIHCQQRLASGNTKSKHIYDESATTITASMNGSAYSSSYFDYSDSSIHGDCVQSTKQSHILDKNFNCHNSEDAATDAISSDLTQCQSAAWLSLDQLKSDVASLKHGSSENVSNDNDDDESSTSSLRLEDITMDTTTHCCNKNPIHPPSNVQQPHLPIEKATEYSRPITMAHDSLTLPQYNYPTTDSLSSWMSNSSIVYGDDVDSDDEDDEDTFDNVQQSLSSEIVSILRRQIKNLSMKLKAEQYIEDYQLERQQQQLIPDDHVSTSPDDSISNYMYDSFGSLSHSLTPLKANDVADRGKANTSKAKEGIFESIRHLEESFSLNKNCDPQHVHLLDDIKQRYNEFVRLSMATETTLKQDYEKKLQQCRDNESKIIELQKKLLHTDNID